MNTDKINNGHEVVVAAPLSSEYVYKAGQIVEILVVKEVQVTDNDHTKTLLLHPYAT